MLTKSELKNLWHEYGFRPNKRLGQNFLIDKNVKDRILRNLELDKGDIVVEIGAGFGEITFDIARKAKLVFAVEKDKRIAGIFKNRLAAPPNVKLIEEEFLDVDVKKLAEGERCVFYGNLPYYVTTPILKKLIDNIRIVKCAYFVVQKEVAERIIASPGSKKIGRLSLYTQYHTDPEIIFTIGKKCFYPEPEVESALLKFSIPKTKKLRVKNEKLLFDIIKAAYSQRRKTLLNSLSSIVKDKETLSALLKTAKIDPQSRPETLSLADFTRLATIL